MKNSSRCHEMLSLSYHRVKGGDTSLPMWVYFNFIVEIFTIGIPLLQANNNLFLLYVYCMYVGLCMCVYTYVDGWMLLRSTKTPVHTEAVCYPFSSVNQGDTGHAAD